MEAKKLSQLEYRVLKMLEEDGRRSASSIAKELGVSRAAVAKAIKSLKEKGVRFTVEYEEEGTVTVFVLAKDCVTENCYKLVDGRSISIFKGSLSEVEEVLSRAEGVEAYFIATRKVNAGKVARAELYCDYCGGEIRGEPITVKVGKKVYYACCRTCERELRKRLSKAQP